VKHMSAISLLSMSESENFDFGMMMEDMVVKFVQRLKLYGVFREVKDRVVVLNPNSIRRRQARDPRHLRQIHWKSFLIRTTLNYSSVPTYIKSRLSEIELGADLGQLIIHG
jgi:hypothetical protein